MKMIQIFLATIFVYITDIHLGYADLKSDLLKGVSDKSIQARDGGAAGGTALVDDMLDFVKDSIFGLLGLISITMFLYVGFRLIKAEGNPEEMKAAFKTLTYVVVGLFIVAISWAAIKIISGLNF